MTRNVLLETSTLPLIFWSKSLTMEALEMTMKQFYKTGISNHNFSFTVSLYTFISVLMWKILKTYQNDLEAEIVTFCVHWTNNQQTSLLPAAQVGGRN